MNDIKTTNVRDLAVLRSTLQQKTTDKDWYTANNVGGDEAFANITKISHLRIKLGLH